MSTRYQGRPRGEEDMIEEFNKQLPATNPTSVTRDNDSLESQIQNPEAKPKPNLFLTKSSELFTELSLRDSLKGVPTTEKTPEKVGFYRTRSAENPPLRRSQSKSPEDGSRTKSGFFATFGSSGSLSTEEAVMREKLGIPLSAWSRRLSDDIPDPKSFQVSVLSVHKYLGLSYRMYKYIQRERAAKRIPIMDPFKSPKVSSQMGCPVGGIGSGSITRGVRGDFMRWQVLSPGIAEYQNVDVNQFSVYISKPAPTESFPAQRTTSTTVLHAGKPLGYSGYLESWDWKVTGDQSKYYAMFPRAWTVYQEPDPQIRLSCKQISPVIPHNYKGMVTNSVHSFTYS
jgi:hypothetical protein